MASWPLSACIAAAMCTYPATSGNIATWAGGTPTNRTKRGGRPSGPEFTTTRGRRQHLLVSYTESLIRFLSTNPLSCTSPRKRNGVTHSRTARTYTPWKRASSVRGAGELKLYQCKLIENQLTNYEPSGAPAAWNDKEISASGRQICTR